MNKKQWGALSIFFVVTMMILIYYDLSYNNAVYIGYSTELSAFEIHMAVFDAIMDICIILSFLFSQICWILGLLGDKK
jgi:uncharacterized membrane protein